MKVILFNKPYGVLCQFSPEGGKLTLKDFIPIPDVYPAGRLDADSEGLLVLTDDGALQHAVSHPEQKLPKTYWIQVEGNPDAAALQRLGVGVQFGGISTLPGVARGIEEPENLWPRNPPVRYRKNIPTSWIEIELREGKNRQVRRMTAAVGFPTLRLVRCRIGDWSLAGLAPGVYQVLDDPHPKEDL